AGARPRSPGHLPRLRPPRGQQLGHRHEHIAALLQRVDDAGHGGHRPVVEVVQQDAAVAGDLGEDAAGDEVGVRGRVVLRGHAPQDLGEPQVPADLVHGRVRAALRRPHERGAVAGEPLDRVVGAGELLAYLLRLQVREAAMGPGVVGQLVPLVGHAPDQRRVAVDVLSAHEEERGGDLLLLQDVQQPRGVLARAGVEGERHALRLAAVDGAEAGPDVGGAHAARGGRVRPSATPRCHEQGRRRTECGGGPERGRGSLHLPPWNQRPVPRPRRRPRRRRTGRGGRRGGALQPAQARQTPGAVLRLGTARAGRPLVPGAGRAHPPRTWTPSATPSIPPSPAPPPTRAWTTPGTRSAWSTPAAPPSSSPRPCPAWTRPGWSSSRTTSPTPRPPDPPPPTPTARSSSSTAAGRPPPTWPAATATANWTPSPPRPCPTPSAWSTRNSPSTSASCAAATSTRSWPAPPTAPPATCPACANTSTPPATAASAPTASTGPPSPRRAPRTSPGTRTTPTSPPAPRPSWRRSSWTSRTGCTARPAATPWPWPAVSP